MFRVMLCSLLLGSSFSLAQKSVSQENEQAASSAEAERKIMEDTLAEVLKVVGKDSERGRMFRKSQNEWVQYVKEQAKADADGVSGEARYPQSYFETLRELTRYRTRVLEGCLSRVKAEELGGRSLAAKRNAATASQSNNSSARDWKAEVGDAPTADPYTLYEAQIENIPGVLGGQWRGEDLWRGVFLADRGDSIILYGGKMERGGVVFEAWQEGTRIGRGFVREEEGDLRGRFFDERRRESPIVLKARTLAKPQNGTVALTPYSGLLGTNETNIGLEWHTTRFLRGRFSDKLLVGFNYSAGKVFLAERATAEGPIVAFWSLAKKTSRGKTRWTGQRKPIAGNSQSVDVGK